MFMSQMLMNQIDRLPTGQGEPKQPQKVEQIWNGLRFAVEIGDHDRLGIVVHRLFAFDNDPRPNQNRLLPPCERQMAALVENVTYLSEGLKVLENDRISRTVLIRSENPRKETDGVSFFELMLRGGIALSLERQRVRRNDVRRPVPIVISTDLFVRLVDDFFLVFRPIGCS